MCRVQKRVSLADVERIFEFGSHRSGSADRKIHERFLSDVESDRMEPDALLFYGSCLEPSDIKYIRPWVDAMLRLIEQQPTITVQIRLRHGRTFGSLVTDSRDTGIQVREFMRVIGAQLRNLYPPETSPNPKLTELVKRFDCTCS